MILKVKIGDSNLKNLNVKKTFRGLTIVCIWNDIFLTKRAVNFFIKDLFFDNEVWFT